MDKIVRAIFKPDGVEKILSTEELSKVLSTWNLMLGILCGAESSLRASSKVIDQLSEIIEGRRSYRVGYDLETWQSQARRISTMSASGLSALSLPEICGLLFEKIGLVCISSLSGQLTEGAVKEIYGPSQWFTEDPKALVDYLRGGPIVIEAWRGEYAEIALLVKFAIRWSLGIEGRYNLIHSDLISQDEYEQAPFTNALFAGA